MGTRSVIGFIGKRAGYKITAFFLFRKLNLFERMASLRTMPIWNPWHGCKKYSAGCKNCYVYRRDESIGKDSRNVTKTGDFLLPLKKNRQKEWKLKPGQEPVYTCMTSDFFLEEADAWRQEAWQMMRVRSDLNFVIITKRILRFKDCLPPDWGDGYENVSIMCTCENQAAADERLPVFLNAPIRHRAVILEPMLEEIHLEPFLQEGKIESLTCGGESGAGARLCDYDWVLCARTQCLCYGVRFHFMQTGAVFQKDGRIYYLKRADQLEQARRARIDILENEPFRALFARLKKSTFRSRFSLSRADISYIREKGLLEIRRHAKEFIQKRLAPANPANDGKQTPMRGHPVFAAQHATGTCCRGCLSKWHGIPQGKPLSEAQQTYVTDVIMVWICSQCRLFAEKELKAKTTAKPAREQEKAKDNEDEK